MGCLKLPYQEREEGLEQSVVFLGKGYKKRASASKFCNSYYPFGLNHNTSWTRTGRENKYKYNAGSEENDITKNYEMYFRDYDPAIGRMMGIDPYAELYRGVNPYHYALNNPIMMNDPSGGVPMMADDPDKEQTYRDAWASYMRSGSMSGAFSGRMGMGSGNYWSDGIGQNDWSAMTGSESYRNALANGFMDNGDGLLWKKDSDGKIINVNKDGRVGYWIDNSGGDDPNYHMEDIDGDGEKEQILNELTIGQKFVEVEEQDMGSEPSWWEILDKITNPYALPDAISISGTVQVVIAGGSDFSTEDFNKLYILKGKSAGQSTSYTDVSVSAGFDLGVSAVVTKYYYTGDINTLTLQDFDGFRFSGSMGVSAFIEIGGGITIAPIAHGGYIIGISTHIGASPPGVSGNAGGGWTRLKE